MAEWKWVLIAIFCVVAYLGIIAWIAYPMWADSRAERERLGRIHQGLVDALIEDARRRR